MGATQSHLFTDEQNELARIARVLAHPARIAILQYLIQANACINGDLVQEIGLAQATISQHLRELKSIGIIQGTIDGVKVSYCIDPLRLSEIKKQLNQLFDSFSSSSLGNCC
ncbi:ArsR family transcriptional regulator [Algoriphagus kandeliae]|uniref:ArsR family transcriptional regulator n=1 Tax=Algoriphagus kandeliae TaxID=2562278 RepID=A0A4Y9QV27_9BACT|nr:metalloregulator ArsR/SmtB family transcription factor [Algoriphagus kandeliae]TFV95990.1 ArsR family transcriptional regulator [Algoriphagus kandeliae]